MLRTLDYGAVKIVECNVIRIPYDILVGTVMDSAGNYYDIYHLADDGTLVAVLDETLED
jgi:hypothetical protein